MVGERAAASCTFEIIIFFIIVLQMTYFKIIKGEYKNGLTVHVGTGEPSAQSPIKKSPASFQSKSESGVSVIDTLKQQQNTVTIPVYDDHWEYDNVMLERLPGVSLGFSIAGGTDNPMYGNNSSIFITKLTPGGLAERDGRLRPNDILYKVNEVDLSEAEHSDAVLALKEAGQYVRLTVKRLHPTLVEDVYLEKTQNGLGFSISGGLFTEHVKNDHGIFVTKIIPGGAADLDGKLSVGDRLISVNDISLEYVTHDDAVAAIASIVEESNEIILRVGKVTQFSTQVIDEATLRLVEFFFIFDSFFLFHK
jgi:hypothetical protein